MTAPCPASRCTWLAPVLLWLSACASTPELESAAAGVCERQVVFNGTCQVDTDFDNVTDVELGCGEAVFIETLAVPQYLLCQCQADGSTRLAFLSSVDPTYVPERFAPDLSDPACTCPNGGFDINGQYVVPSCGESVCGLGLQMYLCADSGVWVNTGEWCNMTSTCDRNAGATPGALCTMPVYTQTAGYSILDMETDYLPHVVACENNGASIESLKAQAIAARSVAYYNYALEGSICDSQQCQVYTCEDEEGRRIEPQPIHYQAVNETRGMVLRYNNYPTYGFYVNGNKFTTREAFCRDGTGANAGYVTYNQWKHGGAVIQTTLGTYHPPGSSTYGANRGCMSQWGSRCLESEFGYNFYDILSFYYGADIEVAQMTGDCVTGL